MIEVFIEKFFTLSFYSNNYMKQYEMLDFYRVFGTNSQFIWTMRKFLTQFRKMFKYKLWCISHLPPRPCTSSPPHSKFLHMTYNVWWRIFYPFVKKDLKTLKNSFLTIYFLLIIIFLCRLRSKYVLKYKHHTNIIW